MLLLFFCLLLLPSANGVGLKIQNLLSGFINCPSNWWEWNGHCYNMICDPVGLTHGEAEAACVKEGGHLASIEDQMEADMLVEETQTGLSQGDSYIQRQPWIGLKRRGLIWIWTDGLEKNFGFKWAPGTPDNEEGNEFCAQLIIYPVYNWTARRHMYQNKTGVLNDYDCVRKVNRYICKKQFEKKTTESSSSSTTTTQTPRIEKVANVSVFAEVVPITSSNAPTTSTLKTSTTSFASTSSTTTPKTTKLTSTTTTTPKTSTSTMSTTTDVSCKPGDFDILDTDLPEKHLYSKRGTKCIPRQPCSTMKTSLSVVFVIDASSSIGRQNWEGVLSFVNSSSHLLPKLARIGFVKFSDTVSAEVWLEAGWTMETFWETMPKDFDQGLTNTPAALEAAGKMLKGYRSEQRFVILVTDGLPKAENFGETRGLLLTQEAVDTLTADNINVIIVGFGLQLNGKEEKLKVMLSNPNDYFGYYIVARNLTPLHMANVLMNVCEI